MALLKAGLVGTEGGQWKGLDDVISTVEVQWWKVFSDPFSLSEDIGKYIVIGPGMRSLSGYLTAVCVVDDFGNLVQVA